VSLSQGDAILLSLELAMQVVFDHAQSQLPGAIAKRVLNRWKWAGGADNQGTPRPATAGFIYTAFHTATQEIRQPPEPGHGGQKRQAMENSFAMHKKARPS